MAALNIILSGVFVFCAFVYQVSWFYYEYLLAEWLVVSVVGIVLQELISSSLGCSLATWLIGRDGDDVLDSFVSSDSDDSIESESIPGRTSRR